MDQHEIRRRRRIILDTTNIPADSVASERLLTLVSDEHLDIPTLAQAIQSEPGITARIISVANAAFITSPKVHTVEQAIEDVLGIKMVRSLCIEMLMRPRFNVHSCPNYSLQNYWCRAQAVAHSASMFAKQIGELDTRTVYLAGLMHSIGQLLQVHHFPEEMNEFLPQLEHESIQDRLKHERKLLGIDSCEAGGWLAKRWNLPDETVNALTHFHDKDYQGLHWKLTRIIGYVVRFFQGESEEETQEVAKLFNLDIHMLKKLKEDFIEINKAVTVLAEYLAQPH